MADVYLDKCLDDIEGGTKYIDQLRQSGYDINFVWKEKNCAYAEELTAEAQRLHNNGFPVETTLNIISSIKKSHENKEKEDMTNKCDNVPDTAQQTVEPEIKNSPIKSTIFFWICVVIVPMLFSLASYLSYALVGLADGLIFNLTMLLVAVIAQAVSCYFGYSIAFHYSPKSNVPMVNGIICIILLAIVSYNSLLYGIYIEVISFVLGIISLIFCIMQKDKMNDILEK